MKSEEKNEEDFRGCSTEKDEEDCIFFFLPAARWGGGGGVRVFSCLSIRCRVGRGGVGTRGFFITRPETRLASHGLRKTKTMTAQSNVKNQKSRGGSVRIHGYFPTPSLLCDLINPLKSNLGRSPKLKESIEDSFR